MSKHDDAVREGKRTSEDTERERDSTTGMIKDTFKPLLGDDADSEDDAPKTNPVTGQRRSPSPEPGYEKPDAEEPEQGRLSEKTNEQTR